MAEVETRYAVGASRPCARCSTPCATGRLDPADAERQAVGRPARRPASRTSGFARVDHHRAVRQGFPEVIFGQGKTPAQVARIADAIVERGHSLLVTRTDATAYGAVAKVVPDAHFHEQARIIERRADVPRGKGVDSCRRGGNF